jgi:hypothetical protein
LLADAFAARKRGKSNTPAFICLSYNLPKAQALGRGSARLNRKFVGSS